VVYTVHADVPRSYRFTSFRSVRTTSLETLSQMNLFIFAGAKIERIIDFRTKVLCAPEHCSDTVKIK
jgi:hypothetical protein